MKKLFRAALFLLIAVVLFVGIDRSVVGKPGCLRTAHGPQHHLLGSGEPGLCVHPGYQRVLHLPVHFAADRYPGAERVRRHITGKPAL